MNAPVFEEAEDIDYLITNFEGEISYKASLGFVWA